ncbi:oligosaccharide flippase family protein [Lactococcus termiticola]|uniref:Flippase n=1 Tax=Lactococcus termiticola TaxID=2169526 RepID=A0A2R5HJP6_9LACT|nr:oligosaccharide flippase family protein [Lactococcus termiticola]GBG96541.1 flippase [Lactococcus termiticola]
MKLIKNMTLSTFYQLMGVLVPLVTAPYVSRVLGSSGLGINAFTASILSYFALFAALGIQAYGNREIAYHQNDVKARSKIFWELVILQAAASLIAILAFFIFLAFQRQYQVYFLLQALTLVSAMVNISWFFMGLENFEIIVFRYTILNLIIVILTFVLVRRPGDLWIYILLMMGSFLLANLSVWPFLKRELVRVSIKELELRPHIGPAVALLVPQIATTAYMNINKSMLGWMDSSSSVAYFTQADMIVRTAFTAVSSFAAAFLPRLSNLFSEGKIEEGKKLILQSLQLMYVMSFLAIAGIIGVSSNFAVFFFGKGFEAVGNLMAIEASVILFFGIAVVLRSQYLMAVRRTKEITIASILALLINIIFNFPLIPLLGALGATITVMFTEAMVTFYLLWTVRQNFRYRDLFHQIWKYLIAAGLAYLVVVSINQHSSATLISFVIQALSGTAVYVLVLYLIKAPIVSLIASIIQSRKKA